MKAVLALGVRRIAARHLSTSRVALAAAKAAPVAGDPFRLGDHFAHRHMGPRDSDLASMLSVIQGGKFKTVEELVSATVPEGIKLPAPLKLAGPIAHDALSETEALAELKRMAAKNAAGVKSFIGMGYYDTITPGVILRNITENPGWYTSYTPYQAEISQGRLESLLNFQTMVCDLTGMDISNASLLDESTAAAEAMQMALNATGNKRTKFFVASDVHPQTIEVVKTRASGLGITVVVGDVATAAAGITGKEYAGFLAQYPNTYGTVPEDAYGPLIAAAKASGTVAIAATDLLATTLLKSPGELGFEIAIGSSQRFGVPMGYGGPHAAFLATRTTHQRRMPGRIIGVSVDSNGNKALRMAMQTREQHIRRDKATSNICTAQALLANMAAMYAVYHGPGGLKAIATRIHKMAGATAAVLRGAGFAVHGATAAAGAPVFFDTITVTVKAGTTGASVAAAAARLGVNVRVVNDTTIGIAFDETTQREHIAAVLTALGAGDAAAAGLDAAFAAVPALPASAARGTPYLTHPVFNTHHSEHQLLRYIHKLQAKDLSLTYSMISLGSCTMKLNATSELIPITWPEFAGLHPFAPREQAAGYTEMMTSLSDALCKITGFAAMSLQPNSGAAGEYAGLMAIRAYHESRGQGHRNVCLIPISAHGTNPASAVMAGYKVVVVASDAKGNVDLADLKAKAAAHADNLAALMITYPSTYGVFEEGVKEIIDVVHGHGGQVYMDGANMNAQVGLTSPGHIGADVCHLNLHKTFAIPHGGGGPGVGSIGVAKHLAPFLPGHPVVPTGGDGTGVAPKSGLTMAGAPFGSAMILPISWMYIHMLGAAGLTKATRTAILNANYLAARLAKHYPIAFTGSAGTAAHEFIIDIRPFKTASGGAIGEEDVAKRLQDYGFHSPTMSWPVAGTLMIEPTESEDKAELDRFADALIAIRGEIDEVIAGNVDPANNVLKNAPHTAAVVTADKWDRPYSRERAAYPAPWSKDNKFWPSVGRVDNVHGDRNLVCTCPAVSEYA